MQKIKKLLNPCADPIFKALFTNNSDEARGALKSFLSSILNSDVTDIKMNGISCLIRFRGNI